MLGEKHLARASLVIANAAVLTTCKNHIQVEFKESMAVEADLVVDVVRRAAGCHSGMIEFPVSSAEQDAVKLAESAGLMRVIANGVAMVTQTGREMAN